jgi:medium-chain acyl-[acyl-carrier-protein] hydrolase
MSENVPWFVSSTTNPRARLRMFCFPHGGGGVSLFREWRRWLPTDIELHAVQLPGRDRRVQEKPFAHVAPLVEALSGAITAYLDLPYVLFGHSMGALIAFELARRLRRLNLPAPARLLVSGRRAPQLAGTGSSLHHLDGEAFIEALRRLGGTPEEVLQEPQLMELLAPVIRADFAMTASYIYEPDAPLSFPINAFGGIDDERVRYDEISAWRTQTSGIFSLDMLPGKHFFLSTARELFLSSMTRRLAT